MNWKYFIRPAKGKIIISIVVTALIYLFTFVAGPMCKPCAELQYEKLPDIIVSCNCTIGQTFSQFLLEVFLVFILPFIITYLIYSVISTFIHRKKQAY